MRNRILLFCVVGVALAAWPVLLQAQGPAPARISPIDAVPSVPEGGFSCPNGGPMLINQQPDQSNGIFADSDCALCGTGEQSVAGDFVLGDATDVVQLVFWGGYFPDNQIPASPDAIDIIFHEDSAGLPGAVIDTQNVVPTSATPTGTTLFGVDEIVYVVDLSPVALPAGTFWMELFTSSEGNSDQFFWEVGSLDGVNGRDGTAFATDTPGASWTATADQNFAFGLCGLQIADLSVTKVADSAEVAPGDTLIYTITVANAGPDDALQTVVSDAFPASLINVSWACAASAGSSCTAAGMGDIDDLADILAGGSVTYTVTATVDPSSTGSISNTATITPGPGVDDPTADDQSSTAVVEALGVLEIPTLGLLGIALLALGLAGSALLVLRRRIA